MKKQLISLLLTLIMCVSLSTEAIAVTAESGTLDNERLVLTPSYDETLLEQNRINAASYALSFVETFFPAPKGEVRAIICPPLTIAASSFST